VDNWRLREITLEPDLAGPLEPPKAARARQQNHLHGQSKDADGLRIVERPSPDTDQNPNNRPLAYSGTLALSPYRKYQLLGPIHGWRNLVSRRLNRLTRLTAEGSGLAPMSESFGNGVMPGRLQRYRSRYNLMRPPPPKRRDPFYFAGVAEVVFVVLPELSCCSSKVLDAWSPSHCKMSRI